MDRFGVDAEAVRRMLEDMRAERGITFEAYLRYAKRQKKSDYAEVFDLIDKDRDGRIDRADLKAFLKSFGGTYALVTTMALDVDYDDVCDDVIGGSDEEGGSMSLETFKKAMRRNARASRATRSSRASLGSRFSRSSFTSTAVVG